jgi:hypothetical protein
MGKNVPPPPVLPQDHPLTGYPRGRRHAPAGRHPKPNRFAPGWPKTGKTWSGISIKK